MGGFHEELYPPSVSNKPAQSASSFLTGNSVPPIYLSLDPAKELFHAKENIVNYDQMMEEKKQMEEKKVLRQSREGKKRGSERERR